MMEKIMAHRWVTVVLGGALAGYLLDVQISGVVQTLHDQVLIGANTALIVGLLIACWLTPWKASTQRSSWTKNQRWVAVVGAGVVGAFVANELVTNLVVQMQGQWGFPVSSALLAALVLACWLQPWEERVGPQRQAPQPAQPARPRAQRERRTQTVDLTRVGVAFTSLQNELRALGVQNTGRLEDEFVRLITEEESNDDNS